MPSPFPGMDPWLEQPGLWSELHTSLITALRDALGPVLRPRYRVAIEQQVYLTALEPGEVAGRPEAGVVQYAQEAPPVMAGGPGVSVAEPITVELPYEEVTERYLEIRKPDTREVITVIEILSPTNKRPGDGRDQYEQKRQKIARSRTHLVEIDLLRDWEPMDFLGPGRSRSADYRILVSQSNRRPQAELYPFNVRDPIPRFRLPLQPDDEEPVVDLKPLLDGIYDRASFDLVVDYSEDPVPPLAKDVPAWAAKLLREAQLVR